MTFNATQLKVLTGDAAYGRGERYFAQKRVQISASDATSVAGVVMGSYRYHCKLSWKNSIRFDCNCPVGDAGDCCKHVVALALAYEVQQQGYAPTYNNPIETYLKAQSPAWLQQTLLDLANKHPEIARQLNRQRQLSGDVDLNELKKTVTTMIGRPRFLDYRKSRDYAVKLQELGELLQQLLQANQAGVCLQLAEFALPKLFKVYEGSDDSGGYIGGEVAFIVDCFTQACTLQAPLNADFVKRLFKLGLDDQWSFINTEQLHPLFSADAMDAWDGIVEAEWAKLVSNKTQDDFGYAFHIKLLVEAKAKARGDVNQLIQLYSQQLSPVNYLKLIEVCTQYNRGREAVLWAERGVKANPSHLELSNKLVALYSQDGLTQEALNAQWQNFVANPSPKTYLKLRELSAKDWSTWRTQALNKLIEFESTRKELPYGFNPYLRLQKETKPDASTRVACLLAEIAFNQNALEEVREILKMHTCTELLSLDYAHLSSKQYPQEAATIMQNIVAKQVNLADNKAYARAVGLVREIKPLLYDADFAGYVAQLRITHKAKRNFMSMLDSAF